MTSRTLPLRRITVSLSAGSDPDAIDDADEVYGVDFPDISDPCPKNHFTGQHEYSLNYYFFARCIHCHQPSGLDR